MILDAKFESTDCLPPRVAQELAVALTSLFAKWGIDLTLRIDRQTENDTYVRFWEWSAAERAKREQDFPKTPAEAEVT